MGSRHQQEKANDTKTMSRRDFINRSSGFAAGAVAAPFVGTRLPGANDRIGLGFIGAGDRAGTHMRMLRHIRDEQQLPVEFVAVCDVYRPRMERRREEFKIDRGYLDHRELLQNKDVDLVCISTPDHLHGHQAIDALHAGKDIYCEKPVTHWRQFELTRKLADLAAQSDCLLQVGTQALSDSAWQQMKKLVREGLIGQPIFGETGYFRVGDWGERGMHIDDPEAKPGPDLNWEEFLGDSPKREFSVDRFFRWRLFEDYAGGPVTDLYPHCLAPVVDILGVGLPSEVVALGGIHRYDYELREVPDTFNLLAQYPEKVTVAVLGTQGNDHQTTDQRGAGHRSPVIRGWEGSLTIDRNREILFTPIKEKNAKEPQRFPITRPEDNVDLWRNLIGCCQTRKQEDLWSPMDLAWRTQAVLQMAMLAFKAGKTARLDLQQSKIVL